MFNLLAAKNLPGWFSPPAGLDFRLVCPESGLPAGEYCDQQVMDYYIPAVSSNKRCTHLMQVFTDPAGRMSYCRNCLPESGYRTEFYPNLLPEMIQFYNAENIPYKKIPPHNSSCSRVYRDQNPVITSLSDGKEYILYSGSGQQLQLSCASAADVTLVYWYLNDKFYRSAPASEKVFFQAREGSVKISCCDDKGRNTDIHVKVSFMN
jgi:penicillin-binding protein 1C